MFHKPHRLKAEGHEFSLRAWADYNGANYAAVLYRWQIGIRDPKALVEGLGKEFSLTQSDYEYLMETAYYRRGQENEWEIACGLIGWPVYRAEDLRRKMACFTT